MDYTIEEIQRALMAKGFNPGPIDGVRGIRTDQAIVDFKRSIGLTARPYIGPLTLAALLGKPAPVVIGAKPIWIQEAMRQFGWHETRDHAKLSVYLKSDGKALGDPRKLPWCGDYVDTVTTNVLPDERLPPLLRSNPYWARNWSDFGRSAKPCYGAYATFWRPGGGGHVGWLVGTTPRGWAVLGGNQGDSVSVVEIDNDRLITTRLPLTWQGPENELPEYKSNSLPKSVNEV